MERYIQEGDRQAARQRGEREGYPAGGYGMSLFLSEWQRRWDGGKAVSSCILGHVSCVVLEEKILISGTGVEDQKLKLALRIVCSNCVCHHSIQLLSYHLLDRTSIVKMHSFQGYRYLSIELHHIDTSASEQLLHHTFFALEIALEHPPESELLHTFI